MAPSEALGKFGVVCGMTMPMLAVPTVFLGAVSLVVTPRMARAAALERGEEIRALAGRTVRAVSLLALPAMALMAAAGGELGALLFRQTGVGEFIVPLAGVMALCCHESALNSILSGVGRQRQVAAVSILSGGVQAAVTFSTAAKLGMAGYVLGAAVSALLGLGLSFYLTEKYTGTRPDWMEWFWMPGLAALLAGLNARLLLRVIRDMGMPALWACLAAMAFGGGVYLAALQAMGMGWRDRGKDRESTTKG